MKKTELSPLDQAPDPQSSDYFTIENLELPEFDVRRAEFKAFQAEQMERLREDGIVGTAFSEATSSSQETPLPDDAMYWGGVYRNVFNGTYGIRFVSTTVNNAKPTIVDVPVYQQAADGERVPFYPFGSVSADTVADAVLELEQEQMTDYPDLRVDLFDLEEPAAS